MTLLDEIRSPADLRGMGPAELAAVSAAVRARLIDVCSRTGGHIGASLGVVELTVALHAAFETPDDQLVWDVGHQGYAHKVLTGRDTRLETLRQEGGLSGFLKRAESPYDAFGAGHASTAIAAAYGLAVGRDLAGGREKVVAIIGDGALTSGLAYEALNNAGHSERDLVVVLNDNAMSIAPNVGAIAQYLNQVQRNPLYNRVRARIGAIAGRTKALDAWVRRWEESLKAMLTPGVLFEELGFRYFGPVDGHAVGELVETLKAVRALAGPRLVHVVTEKGRGFPAGLRGEVHGEKWHALPPGHDPSTGRPRVVVAVPNAVAAAAPTRTAPPAYTAVFGRGLVGLMAERSEVVAITAAMPGGTGVAQAQATHPSRVFDVGIAEGHAVAFAAGLAARGLRPVVAVYSTFLQRAYDQVIHDVALQGLPVVFAMDRAGLVGEDGETHMGLYDVSYLLTVPGITITAPKDGTELLGLLRTAVGPAPSAATAPLREDGGNRVGAATAPTDTRVYAAVVEPTPLAVGTLDGTGAGSALPGSVPVGEGGPVPTVFGPGRGPFALRYPRDSAPDLTIPAWEDVQAVPYATWEILRAHGVLRDETPGADDFDLGAADDGATHDDDRSRDDALLQTALPGWVADAPAPAASPSGVALLAVGAMVVQAVDAAARLAAEGVGVSVVNCRFLKPHDTARLAALARRHRRLLVVEDGAVGNGFGAYLAGVVATADLIGPGGVRGACTVLPIGVPDRVIPGAPRARQLAALGLDAEGLAERVRTELRAARGESEAVTSRGRNSAATATNGAGSRARTSRSTPEVVRE